MDITQKNEPRNRSKGHNGKSYGKVFGDNIVGRYLQSVLGGSVLVNGQQIISLPYVFLLTMLAVVYIGNNYYAHHKIREVNRLEDEMKELRFEYRSTNSRLMFESKQSEVARKLDGTGIRESTEPPKKLFSNPNKDS